MNTDRQTCAPRKPWRSPFQPAKDFRVSSRDLCSSVFICVHLCSSVFICVHLCSSVFICVHLWFHFVQSRAALVPFPLGDPQHSIHSGDEKDLFVSSGP